MRFRLVYFVYLHILGSFALPGQSVHAETKPNVVFILADDVGVNDLSLYGSKFFETPKIDRLAEQGMKFTQAYSASPLCSPTRASIMTGLFPARVKRLAARLDAILAGTKAVIPKPNPKYDPNTSGKKKPK